jgi:hypothetical protein
MTLFIREHEVRQQNDAGRDREKHFGYGKTQP